MRGVQLLADLGRTDRRVISLLLLVLFTSGADMLIITPILPVLARDLGVGVEAGGLWVTAYALATSAFALIFGPVSDRFGRRPILLAGMAALALGTLACGFAWDFTSMVVARVFAGAGAGLLVTSTTCFVGDHFEGHRRAVAMGWVMSGFFLSLILSVPIGASLAGAYGWSHMFFIYAGFATCVLVAIAVGLPTPRYEARADRLSIMSALSGYGALLRDRRAIGVVVMSGTIGMSMTMFSVYSSPWLEDFYGFDTSTRGLIYAVGGPAVILGGPLAGKLSNRFGRVRMVIAGSLIMGSMQVAMPLSGSLSRALQARFDLADLAPIGDIPWPLALPTFAVFFLVMLAGSSRSSPFQTLALEVVPPDRRGSLSAVRNTFNQLGAGLGAAVGGLVWNQSSDNYMKVCLLAAGVTLIGIALLRGLVGRDPT